MRPSKLSIVGLIAILAVFVVTIAVNLDNGVPCVPMGITAVGKYENTAYALVNGKKTFQLDVTTKTWQLVENAPNYVPLKDVWISVEGLPNALYVGVGDGIYTRIGSSWVSICTYQLTPQVTPTEIKK